MSHLSSYGESRLVPPMVTITLSSQAPFPVINVLVGLLRLDVFEIHFMSRCRNLQTDKLLSLTERAGVLFCVRRSASG